MTKCFALVATMSALVFSAAGAATESGSFTVSVSGIRAGTLAYEGTVNGDSYLARGSARASGLLGAILDVRADAAAEGRIKGTQLAPQTASERIREDGEEFKKTYRFNSVGTPNINREPARKKPRKHAADPNAQRGVVDPMTAAFAILRDQTDDTACALDIASFDGARRSRLLLKSREQTNDGVICRGDYIREAGFSPKEMSERVVWPVTLEYSRRGDGTLQVKELSFPTSFGPARIRRQN
ncbi:MAG: DUF3108 domain-containing protein [Pseudomonadota bacterium]